MKKKKDYRILFGKNGALISVKDNGELFAKTTAKTDLPGFSAHMKLHAVKHGAGEKTVSGGLAIKDCICVCPLVCGIRATLFSKKDFTGWVGMKEIMEKM